MPRGKVERFDAIKGTGAIRQDLSGEVLFVHESAVQGEELLPLKAEQIVYFEILDGAHGRQAVDVRLAAGKAEASPAGAGASDTPASGKKK